MDQWRSLVPEPAPFTVDPERADPLDFAPDDPEGIRIDALRWHAQAVAGWHRDRVFHPATSERLPWQRGDLVWALSRADRPWGPASFQVPAMIAEEVPAAWLTECEAALNAIVARLGDGPLADRYRSALARPGGDGPVADRRFSTVVYPVLAGFLGDPAILAALAHTRSLTRPAPSKAWLRQAEALLTVAPRVPAAMRDVLDTLLCTTGAVDDDHDSLLRGVSWLVAAEPGEEASELLAGVALTAGEPAGMGAQPRAARTAAAAVEILADRPGPAPIRALSQLARTARSKPLQARVHAALDRAHLARAS
ncbi:hypothetical protein [Actinoplanes sp. NPDC026670]|uniref:hypothetical protein n=1 Tax=Actinoplanes sp. NPDC026670 TaxID=3154700 RepID=UPI0033D8FDE3